MKVENEQIEEESREKKLYRNARKEQKKRINRARHQQLSFQ